jgi:hypothetical protein
MSTAGSMIEAPTSAHTFIAQPFLAFPAYPASRDILNCFHDAGIAGIFLGVIGTDLGELLPATLPIVFGC